MKREKITISDSGIVTVPYEVKMSISEIAGLFDIYYRTAKQYIRSIEKSGAADGYASMRSSVEGLNLHPDYYGMEMIIAVAFRAQSPKTEVFRKWVMKRLLGMT